MSGDMFSASGEELKPITFYRTNILTRIQENICNYDRQCLIKYDINGMGLCQFCRYSTKFNIPEMIKNQMRTDNREDLIEYCEEGDDLL